MNPESPSPSYDHLKSHAVRTRSITGVPESESDQHQAIDDELVARMAAGDEAALVICYDLWSDRIHCLALRIVGDPDDAADVVEETFWQAWKSADRYERERGRPGAWLLMIARTRALDRLRSRGRARDRELLAAELETHSVQPTETDREVECADTRVAVNSALHSLPAEQRQVLELAYFGGLSHSEIARSTGQALGTVKSRVRLGMNKLRSRLAVLGREYGG